MTSKGKFGYRPILLLGMPRSGTTWLGKIFDSHPGTLYRHEPDSYGRMNFLPLAPSVEEAPARAAEVQAFFEGMAGVRDTKIAASSPIFAKSYLNGVQMAWNRLAMSGAKALTRFTGELRAPLWLPQGADPGYRLVAKSIESVARAGLLARALPEARIIILLRHPCGFVASMLRGKRQHLFADSASIGEDLSLLERLWKATGLHYSATPEGLEAATPAQRLGWQWVLANDKALADTEGRANVTVVRYEDVCTDPHGATERLFGFCDLRCTEQTRRFIDRSTGAHRSRYYSVYKDPVRAANAWRDELDADTLATLRPILAESRAARHFEAELA